MGGDGRRSGANIERLIDLGQFDLTEFALDAVNDAIAHAAATAGPLRLTVLRPTGAASGVQDRCCG